MFHFLVFSLQSPTCIFCVKHISILTSHILCAQKLHCVTHPTLLDSEGIEVCNFLGVIGSVEFVYFLTYLQSDMGTQSGKQLTHLDKEESDQANLF